MYLHYAMIHVVLLWLVVVQLQRIVIVPQGTTKGRAIIHEDNQELKDWFYHALARGNAEFQEMLYSPLRVILEIVPEKWIAYDGAKSREHHAGTIDERELDPMLSSDTTRMKDYREERSCNNLSTQDANQII